MSTQQQPVDEVLAEASTEALLDTFAALTHRIHEATEATTRALGTPYGLTRGQRQVDGLRAQRDLVRAEVLRRAGA